MSFFAAAYSEEKLPHRARSVYMYLRECVNRDGTCWPGVKTIGKDLKLSPRTVQRALIDLEKAGLVTREARFRDNGSCTSNLFAVKK